MQTTNIVDETPRVRPSGSSSTVMASNQASEEMSLRKLGKQALRVPFQAVRSILAANPRSSVGEIHVPAFLTRTPDPKWIDIEMMGHWLNKCDTEHGKSCRTLFGLDSSGHGQAQWLVDIRRICLTPAKPEYRYACLSYVWGGAKMLKAGKENLDELCKDNSLASHWDDIPKTIRNTIDLVDQLGIPYLWVDCLCIIQDDDQSKHEQIEAMSGIYAKAYVTIIAGNGWDADHGLRGLPGITEPRQLSSFLKNDLRENLQPYSSIWYSRGWTFQEMIFSPRKVMFQYQVAIWECNHDAWHESSLCTGSSSDSKPIDLFSSFNPSISPWQSRIKVSAWPDVQQYVSLVSDYTERRLTYANDGLYAISSLLSMLERSFTGGFIGGLPQIFFHEALLWQPDEPMQQRRSPEDQHVHPSWSWVGWEGKIMANEWVHHFRHLFNRQLGLGVPKGWHHKYPVLPVIPTTSWSWGVTLHDRWAIEATGQSYIDRLWDTMATLPPGWTRDNSTLLQGYIFNDQRETRSNFPLPTTWPTTKTTIPQKFPARYLFCRTTRGYLLGTKQILRYPMNPESINFDEHLGPVTVPLQVPDGHLIGELNLNLAPTSFSENAAAVCQQRYELVVISAGEILGTACLTSSQLNWTWQTDTVNRVTLPAAYGWKESVFELPPGLLTDTKSDVPSTDEVFEIYNVLWIQWEDGVAYRQGLGRVFKKLWDRLELEEIDLVLG